MVRLRVSVFMTTLFHYILGSTDFQCDYNTQHKWYVLGIYSACYDKANRSELNILAEDLDKTVKYMWELKATSLHYPITTTYISLDVCEDFNQLPKIVEAIYLNETFHFKTWSQESKKTDSFSSIIAIYAEVPTEMMNYLTASFDDNARFTGRYTSFNSSTN